MQDLIKQEKFELEVLERLNSKKLLNSLVFGGGTMLRLCFGLDRFSVDLDFWVGKGFNKKKLFDRLRGCLAEFYTVTDSADKFYTLLFEIKSKDYPRCLKIEIRKEKKSIITEQAIAYSKYSNIQVLLRIISLKEMMGAKIAALLDRKEIRDAFDIEFLLKKGVKLNESPKTLQAMLKEINSFTKNDYSVKLGSLLEPGQRKYYSTESFKILKAAIGL